MDDQPTPTSKSRWRLPSYETERAQKWGRGALIAGVVGVLAMLGGSMAGTWFVLGGIAAHLAARRMDRGVAPVASLGELTQWRPQTNKEKGWLGFAALLAVVGLGAFGGNTPPETSQPQGIADQQQLTVTEAPELPEATNTARPSSTPRPTAEPATATDEPEPTDEPPTAVPPTEVPPPTDAPVVEPTVPPPAEPQPAARTRGGPQGSDCPADLPVKGNQGSNGWIYHVRGQSSSYNQTKPEECFATAADAEAAGYRAPRR